MESTHIISEFNTATPKQIVLFSTGRDENESRISTSACLFYQEHLSKVTDLRKR